jgi:integrase
MANVCSDPNGRKRIQFVAPDGTRRSIRLGKCSMKAADTIRGRVEQLLSAKILGSMDRDLSLWVASIDVVLREKLERAGLLEPITPEPTKPKITLDDFLTDFLARNGATKKPATREVWRQVMAMLREYMPKGIAIDDVTAGHAKRFHEQLKERGLASATIHKRIGFARQFFQDAVDWELIDRNPFARVKTQTSSTKSNVDVPRETIERVLQFCDPSWRAIVALSRFGGLRCPSEVLSLKWIDIDWEHNRMHVPEPKVEHHEGRGVRCVPLFAELRSILNESWELAPDGSDYVINKPAYRIGAMLNTGWGNANLRTQFLRILKRAGVTPWSRLFHSMRASRQTELERDYPRHVVCAWMGNTEAVASKHYLMVTEEDFQKAAQNPAQLGSKAVHFRAQQASATDTQENEETPGNAGETCVSSVLSGVPKAEGTGLEPAAPYGVPQFQ